MHILLAKATTVCIIFSFPTLWVFSVQRCKHNSCASVKKKNHKIHYIKQQNILHDIATNVFVHAIWKKMNKKSLKALPRLVKKQIAQMMLAQINKAQWIFNEYGIDHVKICPTKCSLEKKWKQMSISGVLVMYTGFVCTIKKKTPVLGAVLRCGLCARLPEHNLKCAESVGFFWST